MQSVLSSHLFLIYNCSGKVSIKSNLRVQVAKFLRNIHQGVNLRKYIALDQSLTWKKVVNLLDVTLFFPETGDTASATDLKAKRFLIIFK